MFQTDIDKALERYPNKLIITLEIKVLCIITALKRFKLMDLSEKLKIQQVRRYIQWCFRSRITKGYSIAQALKLANLAQVIQ